MRDTGPRRILTVFGAEGHGDASQRPVLGEVLHYKAGSAESLLSCHVGTSTPFSDCCNAAAGAARRCDHVGPCVA